MGSSFDFNWPDVSPDAVRAVANEMSDGGLKPLTDDERDERERWREEQRRQRVLADEFARMERDERLAEQEAQARHGAALERQEANHKARLARSAEIERQTQQQQLADLQLSAAKQEAWRTNVQQQMARNQWHENTSRLIAEFERAINPPQPIAPPEPIFIEVEQPERETGLDYPRLHRWF